MGLLKTIAGAVAGPIVSGLFSKSSQDKALDAQRYQSAHAHQIEVADLRAAGLNPILSAKYGGAPQVGGAMATMPSFDLNQAEASAQSARKSGQERKVLEQEERNRKRIEDKLWFEIKQIGQQNANTAMDTLRKEEEWNQIKLQNQILTRELKLSEMDKDIYAGDKGMMLRWLEKLNQSGVRSIMPGRR